MDGDLITREDILRKIPKFVPQLPGGHFPNTTGIFDLTDCSKDSIRWILYSIAKNTTSIDIPKDILPMVELDCDFLMLPKIESSSMPHVIITPKEKTYLPTQLYVTVGKQKHRFNIKFIKHYCPGYEANISLHCFHKFNEYKCSSTETFNVKKLVMSHNIHIYEFITGNLKKFLGKNIYDSIHTEIVEALENIIIE